MTNVAMRQRVERQIARAAINGLLAAGYTVSVNNGGDTDEIEPSTDARAILKEMFATDEEHLIAHRDGKRSGWVFFVYGNDGWDVISDYTTNLEQALAGAKALADKIGGRS